ncbi:Mor transcription activator family protein [Pseudomonas nitroreducens]|uniref:Mor transcription activator domain-containing protein n=1 Tax=Pseudomonas nitroreducens TaxID=46680 RepID=A0A6G6IT42_PSENT|nr:Mor transcription activator family protein [Pseudomonas nitroreducens]QIE86164.1 hypothetical protein G5B91_07760 [Pseudomonas nitroreducens]
MNLEQVREQLPAQVLEIAQVVGMSAALRLVNELGGTTWDFAKGSNRNGVIKVAALADIVGDEAAERLTARFAGNSFYVARCDVALRRLRDLEIHRQFDQAVREGVSTRTVVAELARTYKLSDRRIWIILKQYLPEPSVPTGKLFD